jgi:hypothetical protein
MSVELLRRFKFMHKSIVDRIYTAEKLLIKNIDYYVVIWVNTDGEIKIAEYQTDAVEMFIKDGIWVIIPD